MACVASSHALGGFPNALRGLRDLVEPGGQVLLGEGYWRREPTAAYLEALGGASADERLLPGCWTRHSGRASHLFARWRARRADWDRYEWTLILNAERWADVRAGDPSALVLRERAARARARLALPGGRETLGFAADAARRTEPLRNDNATHGLQRRHAGGAPAARPQRG